MINLSETLKPKPRKKSKKKTQPKNTQPKTPLTHPSTFVAYGKGTYTVLCYASMRSRMTNQEWFPINDYRKFQEHRYTSRQISNWCTKLHKLGYLTRKPLPHTEHRQQQGKIFEYKITLLGLHAINQVTQTHKKRHK
jgi:hypothetical protein